MNLIQLIIRQVGVQAGGADIAIADGAGDRHMAQQVAGLGPTGTIFHPVSGTLAEVGKDLVGFLLNCRRKCHQGGGMDVSGATDYDALQLVQNSSGIYP